MPSFGTILIFIGIVLLIFGVVAKGWLPFLGHLPGDIIIRRGNTTFYFPIATSILISLIITILLSLFRR